MTFWQMLEGVAAGVTVLTFLYKFHSIEKNAESLSARHDKLEKELNKDRDDAKHTIKQVAAYYEEQVKRQEQEVKRLHICDRR